VAKIRVVLADNHLAVLARVHRKLVGEFDILGTATNGQQAVDAVASLDPDVLIMDISMPLLDGLQAASLIRSSGSKTKVIFLTVHEDTDFIAAAFVSGALGYVTKPRLSTDLVRAIHEALSGRTFVSPLNV
jgi:DNA-binding NarL/FixJ family response regulator